MNLKQKNTIASLLFSGAFFAACSSHRNSSVETKSVASPLKSATVFQVSECPQITGNFVLDGGTEQREIKSSVLDKSLIVEDATVRWIIDGTSHTSENAPDLTFVGTCLAQVLKVSIYQKDLLMTETIYSLNEKGQLLTEEKNPDLEGDSVTQEIWNPQVIRAISSLK